MGRVCGLRQIHTGIDTDEPKETPFPYDIRITPCYLCRELGGLGYPME